MTNKLALAWIHRLAASAEALQVELSESDEVTALQEAQYDVIVETGGEAVDMAPREQISGPIAMAEELSKVILVSETTEDSAEVTDEEVTGLMASAIITSIEEIQQDIAANGFSPDHVNRYNAVYKVFFDNPSVDGSDSHPDTEESLIGAMESLHSQLTGEYSVSAESFSTMIENYGK